MFGLPLALALSATATPTPGWTQSPLAFGTKANVMVAERAARRCGMRYLHQRRYKNGKAMLWMGRGNSRRALDCTEKWLADHESSFDPLLGIE